MNEYNIIKILNVLLLALATAILLVGTKEFLNHKNIGYKTQIKPTIDVHAYHRLAFLNLLNKKLS